MRSKFNSAALVCLLILVGAGKTFATVIANAGVNQAICSGQNVVIGGTPTASGGTGPYTYVWSPAIGLSSNSISNPSATPTTTTTYMVTVTDNVAATATASVTITVNPIPHIDSIPVTNASCNGENNGAACVYAQGAIAPYEWSNGATSQCIAALLAWQYNVTVTNAFGCTASASATVSQPAPISISNQTANALCNGLSNGSIIVTGTGGTQPYRYSLNWGPVQGSNTFTGLAAGTYTIDVWDTLGCFDSLSATINQPSVFTVPIHGTNGTCGTNNGTLIGQPIGGTPGYTFVWNPFATSSTLTGLGPGTYSITATDQNGCTASASSTISASPDITIDSIQLHPSTCYNLGNGNICVYPSGAGPFTYEWSDFETAQCNFYLSAGRFYLTITDSYGCTSIVDTTMSQPTAIQNSFNVNNAGCTSNGGILANVTGGTPPYSYQWSNSDIGDPISGLVAGNYGLTITDANGCILTDTASVTQVSSFTIDSLHATNITCAGDSTGSVCVYTTGGMPPYNFTWNNSVSSGSNCLTQLSISGTYVVTVTSGDGCTATASAAVSIPPQLQDLFNVTGVTCYGDSDGVVNLLASGGTPTYSYDWSNGETTRQLTSARGGTYTVTITDANGCTITDSAQVINPGQLYTSGVVQNASCFGSQNGSVVITVYGGTVPYSYHWDNGVTTLGQSGLIGGNYFVTVTDAHGCQVSSLYVIREPALLTLSVSATLVLCFDSASGAVAALPVGGTLPYHYFWSNSSTDSSQTGLPAGLYGLQLSDSNNCSASASANVSQPQPVQIALLSQTNIACFGGNNGALCPSVSGGVTPYTYLWSNFQNTSCVSGLGSGTYYLFATDHNGCTARDSFTITQPAQLTLQVNAPDTNAIPDSISFIVGGGTAPYFYIWDDGQNPTAISSHIYNAAGIYLDTITDHNGCTLIYRVDAGCSDSCVWPGDANYDGLVDNNDLLAIGVAYDSTGYARLNPTISFEPQYCQNWPYTLSDGINYKHADCNGDGIINGDDTSAIVLNYDRTHQRGGGYQPWKSNAPALQIKLSPDTLVDGQIATATLSLGDSAQQGTNVYALAFTYNFDPLVVDTGSISITFGNSWLAGNGDHINISKTFYGPGQVQAALTRINHLNRSGYGPIGTVSMKITTGNINGKNLSYYTMKNFITGLTVVDKDGNVLPVNAGFDSVPVAFTPTGINTIKNNINIQIFPNPANDQLNITTGLSQIQEISIVDLTGQQVLRQNPPTGTNFAIDISGLSAGVYLINIKANSEEFHTRFMKVASK